MVTEIQYTSIKRVLDNLLDHPMLKDLTLEQAVRHTIRFISLHGYSKLYKDKIDLVDIKDFRGTLPCDLISIIQVKDKETGECLRAMTDNFSTGMNPCPPPMEPPKDLNNNIHQNIPAKPVKPLPFSKHHKNWYIPPLRKYFEEPAFKTQGRIIFTSFPCGVVEIAYKSIPVDEDGFPLLIDNETYLAALEAYIKKQVFTVKFDTGKIQAGVLQNAQQEYAFLAGQLENEFVIPSTSEMEALTRMWNTLIPQVRHFDNGFRNMGDREYIKKH